MRVRRVFRALLLASEVFVFISVSQCFGSVVSTRLISMSFADDTWYEWDGSNGNIAFDPHNVVIGNFYTHQMVITPFGLTEHFNMAVATFGFVRDMKRDVADELLVEEGAGLTDSEVSDLEDDLAELEAMLDDMNMDENFVIEDV